MIANQAYALQKKTDLMLVNLVTGHEKAPLQMSLVSDEYQKEVVSALDVEDSTMTLTLGVIVALAVALVLRKVMAKYETWGTGIAPVHFRQLCRLHQQLEVLIDQ